MFKKLIGTRKNGKSEKEFRGLTEMKEPKRYDFR
jgi:hypothetical protein